MKYEYIGREVDPFPGESGPQYVYEPRVVVLVIGPSSAWRIRGLLDTGASLTLLPMKFLERLGVEKGPRFSLAGAGGTSFPAWLAAVDLELPLQETVCHWSARVAFTPMDGDRATWGRAGFLDYFAATFNGRRRYATLQPNGTFPPPIYKD